MKSSLRSSIWIRRAVSVTAFIGVIMTLHTEKPLVATAIVTLADEGPMPDLGGAVGWLNSAPLNRKSLRGKVVLVNFSRDLHLVLAPGKDGKPARFVVRLDGAAPGENCGIDTAPDGSGEIREPRLYQLIRQKGPIVDRTIEIEFLDPGVHALDFTFG